MYVENTELNVKLSIKFMNLTLSNQNIKLSTEFMKLALSNQIR